MLRKLIFWAAIPACFAVIDAAVAADRFAVIKTELAEAPCVRFEFLSIIESEIFDQTDTVEGEAYIARDGRYNVTIGTEQYLFDGDKLYSYSADNNQVVIESIDEKEETGSQISFITRLDEFYRTQVVTPGERYRLARKADVQGELPDSISVILSPQENRIARLEYFDVNDERNVIVILKQLPDTVCFDERFRPNFPDSVEKIKL
jgi:outer membrane lipoprotein-sorting protein